MDFSALLHLINIAVKPYAAVFHTGLHIAKSDMRVFAGTWPHITVIHMGQGMADRLSILTNLEVSKAILARLFRPGTGLNFE